MYKLVDNVVVGAGNLVTMNISDGVVAVGVPCKVIGDFDEYMSRLRDEEGK